MPSNHAGLTADPKPMEHNLPDFVAMLQQRGKRGKSPASAAGFRGAIRDFKPCPPLRSRRSLNSVVSCQHVLNAQVLLCSVKMLLTVHDVIAWRMTAQKHGMASFNMACRHQLHRVELRMRVEQLEFLVSFKRFFRTCKPKLSKPLTNAVVVDMPLVTFPQISG